jgi:23S rRNA pseudouridine1911/1915/1917 synthase
MNLKIVFEDAHLLVLYKPAGVPVQSARVGVKDCESMLKNYLYEKNPGKGEPYLGLIHRLDQPVEGLLVFARTPAAAAELSRQMADGRMKKQYLALRRTIDTTVDKSALNPQKYAKLCGKTTENVESFVDNWVEQVDYLRKCGRENTSEIVSEKTAGAKKAVLRYQILARAEGLELLEIQLQTGRHHQIRVQMAGMGTPLVGDRKYGIVENSVDNVDNVDKIFPALCAYHLELIHPKTKKKMVFEELPKNSAFQKWIG